MICPEDILERLNYPCASSAKEKLAAVQLTAEEKLISDFLASGARNFDEILLNTKISAGVLQSYLSKMEIEGIVVRQNGNFYKLNNE